MISVLTTLKLLKPTFLFVFNLKLLRYLLTVPFALSVVVLLTETFYPLFYLAETAEVTLKINFYMLVFISSVFIFLTVSLMLKVQQIVFFGETQEEKKFFVPIFNKNFFLYVLRIIYIFVNSFFFALIAAIAFVFILRYFFPSMEKINLFVFGATILFLPYFMIRFCMGLPAVVAGDKIHFWDSWKMTRRINSLIALICALFILLPSLIVALLYKVLQSVFENIEFVFLMTNISAFLSLLFSCVLLSAYLGYLYSVVSDRA